MIRKFYILLLIVMPFFSYSQSIGIKTNLAILGTASPNAGLEFRLGKKTSLSIEGSYNPFTFKNDLFWKHWFAQPEFRWWYCHQHAGSFWGIHSFYGEYNIDIPDITKYRYEGELYGVGLSYGYSWILSNRWNIETVIGIGYSRLSYDKFECGNCGEKLGSYQRNYLGPTKTAVSLIYFIQ